MFKCFYFREAAEIAKSLEELQLNNYYLYSHSTQL